MPGTAAGNLDPMRQPVIADRYYVTWEEIGRPTVRGDYEIPGLGTLVFDDADAFHATKFQNAGFFVRRSKALGGRYVVVAREQSA
ncbi:MAG: hypothetical protein JST30_09995 [Armatimonadetes bacterium]|nr:hypothetical protein [Armatimonadota bacterium]